MTARYATERYCISVLWLKLALKLFFEKALDLFLPELFSRWSKKGTNHIVSVVLFARVMYDKEEIEVVQRPLMHYDHDNKEEGAWTDIYKASITETYMCRYQLTKYTTGRGRSGGSFILEACPLPSPQRK